MSELRHTHIDDQVGARTGTVLLSKYRLGPLLGRGGMGEVYEATHLGITRPVAIKLLLPELAAREAALKRFENEVRAVGGLTHDNIVAVTDVGTAEDGSRFLVMECLVGEDLATYLKRKGPLRVGEAVEFVIQACRGVEAAHARGIIHRDLKPANLFLVQRADQSTGVKVLDFGIATLRPIPEQDAALASTALGVTGGVGTPYYMAPEQVTGLEAVNARTDVYALGVLLFELLTGQKPFQGASPRAVAERVLRGCPNLSELRADVPPAICTIVERAMKRAMSDRYPSAADMRDALTRSIGGTRYLALESDDVTSESLGATLESSGVTLESMGAVAPALERTAPRRRASRRALALLLGSGALLISVALYVAAAPRGALQTPTFALPSPSAPQARTREATQLPQSSILKENTPAAPATSGVEPTMGSASAPALSGLPQAEPGLLSGHGKKQLDTVNQASSRLVVSSRAQRSPVENSLPAQPEPSFDTATQGDASGPSASPRALENQGNPSISAPPSGAPQVRVERAATPSGVSPTPRSSSPGRLQFDHQNPYQ